MNTTFDQLRIEGAPTKDACVLIGRARATHYRHLQPPVRGPAPARASPTTASTVRVGALRSVHNGIPGTQRIRSNSVRCHICATVLNGKPAVK